MFAGAPASSQTATARSSPTMMSAAMLRTGIFTAFVIKREVAAATWANGVETLRVRRAPIRLNRGQAITVWGTTPEQLSGTFKVERVNGNSLSYLLPHDPGPYHGGGYIAPEPSSHACIIRGNFLHDTGQTIDVNQTAAGGIENNCVNSRVEDNRAWNLGGAGFVNYASGVTYVGNQAREVGHHDNRSAGGDGDLAGFAVSENGSGMPWYELKNLAFERNSTSVSAGRPRYGYFEEPWHLFNAALRGNAFAGSERSMMVRSKSCRAAPVLC